MGAIATVNAAAVDSKRADRTNDDRSQRESWMRGSIMRCVSI